MTKGAQYGAGPTTVMQVGLEYLLTEIDLDDSHFPGSQRVLRTGGLYINYLRGAFHQKHASSTIEGNGIMNTMTKLHGLLFGKNVCVHRNMNKKLT